MHCFSLRHRGHKLSFGPLPIWTADDCRCATLHYSAISWSSTSRSRASSRIHRFFLLVTNFLLIFRQATQEFFVIDSVLSLTSLSLGEVMWLNFWHSVYEKAQLFALFKQQLKAVHFKKTVARISFHSKLWYFQYKSKQKVPQFWKKRDSRNCLLKMNGL